MNRSLARSLGLVVATIGVAHAGSPSDEEARAWAGRAEETVSARDPDFLNRALDEDAVIERSLEGINLEPDARRGLVAGIKESGSRFGDLVVQGLGTQGTWKFLHL